MIGLMKLRKQILLEKKIFINENEFKKMIQVLFDISNNKNISSENKINNSIIERSIHYLEITNWLNFLETSL